MRLRASAAILALLILLIGGAGYYFSAVNPITSHISQGLELKGGIHIVLQAKDPNATSQQVKDAMKIIEYRVNKLGVSNPVVQFESPNRIVVDVAGVQDIGQAEKVIGTTAKLQFAALKYKADGTPETDPTTGGYMIDPNKIYLEGKDLKKASVYSGQSGDFGVTLQLNDVGAQKFADATKANVGKPIAIVLDGKIFSAPVVQSVIVNGTASITGNYDAKSAQQLADVLNGGALPVDLVQKEAKSVSATLGSDSFQRSLKAGAIGLGGIALFMLLRYRGAGLLATIALMLYLMINLGVLIGIGQVFDLADIAAVILSLGIAVDANVITFERVKEEIKAGRTLRSGMEAGFKRAFSTVFDANVTTIIASLLLYWMGRGGVKGFGLTLAIGVAISMFTAITVSRWFLRLAADGGLSSDFLFGVKVQTTKKEVTR